MFVLSSKGQVDKHSVPVGALKAGFIMIMFR